MNPLTLTSALAVFGMLLILAALARTMYSLGHAELERRGEARSAAPLTGMHGALRLLDLERNRPATKGVWIYAITAATLAFGAILWARGGSLEKLLASGQVCLTGVLMAREQFF